MARTLPAIIVLVLSWYIESSDVAASSDIYHWSPAAPPRYPTTVTPRTTTTPSRPYPPPVYQPNPPQGYQPNPPQGYQPNPPQGYQPNPPQGYQPNPPQGYQPNPPQGYQPNPPQGYQPNPPQGYQPNPAAAHPRPTSTAYSRTTSKAQRPNPQATYQRNPSSSYHRNPPGRNPYGYGHYTVVEKCTNPSLSFRIFAHRNNTSAFWQIPRMPQAGDEITVGKSRKGRSIWVLEFVNVTSSDPRYLIRTNGSNPLYVTHSYVGEVSLQQQVTQQSYFIYKIRGGGGYSIRVPGTNRSIGMVYGKLRILNGQYIWRHRLAQPFTQMQPDCPEGWSQRVAIEHDLLGMKWYFDDQVSHNNVPAHYFMGTTEAARWISKEHEWGSKRDFRSTVFPNNYVTWSSNSNQLEFQTAAMSESTPEMRLFRVEMEDFGIFQLSTPTQNPNYVHIEAGVLGLGGPSDAVTWNPTFLGECCGLNCEPMSLFRTCVSELVVATSIQMAPPRSP